MLPRVVLKPKQHRFTTHCTLDVSVRPLATIFRFQQQSGITRSHSRSGGLLPLCASQRGASRLFHSPSMPLLFAKKSPKKTKEGPNDEPDAVTNLPAALPEGISPPTNLGSSEPKQPHTVLIDGSFLTHRAFHSPISLKMTNPQVQPTISVGSCSFEFLFFSQTALWLLGSRSKCSFRVY